MTIRNLRQEDIPILQKWHVASGFSYPFPEFFVLNEGGELVLNPVFEIVRVEVDEEDRPIQAVAAKKSIELYFLLDSTWRNPRWRLEAFTQLHRDMERQLATCPAEDANCWIPPQVEKSFGRRLTAIFGWVKSSWNSYSHRIEKNQ